LTDDHPPDFSQELLDRGTLTLNAILNLLNRFVHRSSLKRQQPLIR
jgi:hypothetical protein